MVFLESDRVELSDCLMNSTAELPCSLWVLPDYHTDLNFVIVFLEYFALTAPLLQAYDIILTCPGTSQGRRTCPGRCDKQHLGEPAATAHN